MTLQAPATGGKKQKKKWSKGKVKDKAQHAVILDKTTSDRLYKDVQSYRLVTIATLVDRMKINGSLARKCLADLEEKGMIKPVVTHSKMKIYSMAAATILRWKCLNADYMQPVTLAALKLDERKDTSLRIWRLECAHQGNDLRVEARSKAYKPGWGAFWPRYKLPGPGHASANDIGMKDHQTIMVPFVT